MSELETIEERVRSARASDRTPVAVLGLGFVGCAVAAVIADASDASDVARHLVIGVDLPTAGGRRKVESIERGACPVASTDASLREITRRAACDRRSLLATTDSRALSLVDVIVIDIGLDLASPDELDGTNPTPALERFLLAVREVGRHMAAHALVILETTVPVGTCRHHVEPFLLEERERRGITEPLLLAHAYERVMPGPAYVSSIREMSRPLSATSPVALQRARDFFAGFVDPTRFGPVPLAAPEETELAKLLENSYRALNIAFLQEWTELAEAAGVNLWAVVEAVRARTGTHDNLRSPGIGVGGYCLPKDPHLAIWSAQEIYGLPDLPLTRAAARINEHMPRHALRLLDELFAGSLDGRRIAVCGVSYRPDVGDTRGSPAACVVDELEKRSCDIVAWDPMVESWPERPQIPLHRDLRSTLIDAEAILLALPHPDWRHLDPADLFRLCASSVRIVDACNAIDDANAAALVRAGAYLAGVGKGHWRRAGHHQGVHS